VYVHQAEGDQGGGLKDWNVTALTDLTHRVLERNWYSPYGELEVSHEAHFFDFDADGDVDDDDLAAADTNGICRDNYAGAGGDCKRLDADADGDVDAADLVWLGSYFAAGATGSIRRTPVSRGSSIKNIRAHQGLCFDQEATLYQNRHRQYLVNEKRYAQRDPVALSTRKWAAYLDGLSLYAYVRQSPYLRSDASGLSSIENAIVDIMLSNYDTWPCGSLTIEGVSDCQNNLSCGPDWTNPNCLGPRIVLAAACLAAQAAVGTPVSVGCRCPNQVCCNRREVSGTNTVTVHFDNWNPGTEDDPNADAGWTVNGSITATLTASGWTGDCQSDPKKCTS
jgi:RHS repeat-associated protein